MKKILFILGELADADVDWLLYVGRKEKIAAGTTLIQEGFPVDTLYLVLTGALSVTIDKIGKEIARLDSGEVVGEISFLDARPPVATVRALTDSLVFSIPRQQLQQKLAEDSAFSTHFYRAIALLMADRMRNTVALLGYGEDIEFESPFQIARDLSPTVVEHLPMARQRLVSLVKRLRGF
ncbi:cyclic nucleotide-binding domain-containing protein [filamentous cyanobacterium LEGE 11480]|uniref:Cyclic nucleotide-binding domain-containing protein n=1 Tax=Romeriopsis navalis LEGE 11480 TaxID=2777977 RepID=A0A928VTJ0_9CYAN|nr:cyclic nucleotide-binding domain-containing protein [Romeriopsis navalis]MBE9033432.1 cyclic nucleotide-binding domain-containing protein [Romeriopsis navalis LEGE 11480]